MLMEIFAWLEQYSGISYGFQDTVETLKGDYAFGEPFLWKCGLELAFETMSEILDLVDRYADYIPDDLPSRPDMKKLITDEVTSQLLDNINHVKQSLSIDVHEYRKYTEILMHVNGLYELICLMVDNPIEDIFKKNLFERLDESMDHIYTDTFGIARADLSNIHFAVNDMRDNYNEKMTE